MKSDNGKVILTLLSLAAVAFAAPAEAARKKTYRIAAHEARLQYTTNLTVGTSGAEASCPHDVLVTAVRLLEVSWDLDTGEQSTVETGPDVTYSINVTDAAACPAGLSLGSDPFPLSDDSDLPRLQRPYFVSGNGKGTARVIVNADDVVASGNESAFNAALHLVWDGRGEEVTRTKDCFAFFDEATATCFRTKTKAATRAAVVAGDLSGTVTTPFGGYGLDATPGAFSFYDPAAAYISRMVSLDTIKEQTTARHCVCPSAP